MALDSLSSRSNNWFKNIEYAATEQFIVLCLLHSFALIYCIALVWAFAAFLTVAGAYNNVKQQAKLNI